MTGLAPPPSDSARAEKPVGGAPLPRPDPLINRVVARALGRRAWRRIELFDLGPYFEESILALDRMGADRASLRRVDTHFRRHWRVSHDPAPPEVWCGEVFWPADDPDRRGTPRTVLYPNSPWGRLPKGLVYRLASQTGMDHMVSHLYRWFAGIDFSEEAACADQARMMLVRPSASSRVAAPVIAVGLWRHKRIPLRTFLVAARQALNPSARRIFAR